MLRIAKNFAMSLDQLPFRIADGLHSLSTRHDVLRTKRNIKMQQTAILKATGAQTGQGVLRSSELETDTQMLCAYMQCRM